MRGPEFLDLGRKKHRINFVMLLAKRFHNIIHDPQQTGKIHIDGMMTWIAYGLHLKGGMLGLTSLALNARLTLDRLKETLWTCDTEGLAGVA